MARGGGVSSRGRGKFKVSRGGGRHFSRDLDPRFSQQRAEGSEEEESSEEESEEEESDDDDQVVTGPGGVEHKLAPEMAALNLKLGNTESVGGAGDDGEMSRAERKALKKAQAAGAVSKKSVKIVEPDSDEDDEDEYVAVPAPKQAQVKQVPAPSSKPKPQAAPELSRREREAADKKAAAERYAKLHAQGKTDQAKSDLARLQEVRRKREAAAAQRVAEQEEAAREAAAKASRQVRR